MRQIINVFTRAGEVHEFTGLIERSIGLKRILQEVFNRFYVMISGSFIEVLGESRRTAGFTAVPVAAEIITRVAPILNLRPIATDDAMAYTSISSQ